jgi:hypothetical protein
MVDTGTVVVGVLIIAEVVFAEVVVVIAEVVVDALLHPLNATRAIASKIDENRINELFKPFIFPSLYVHYFCFYSKI